MYKKTSLFISAAPCAWHTSVPQWHVDQRHLGNIHPQLCVVEAKSIFGRMHMFHLRGWEHVVWRGEGEVDAGRGTLPHHHFCRHTISATCTHSETDRTHCLMMVMMMLTEILTLVMVMSLWESCWWCWKWWHSCTYKVTWWECTANVESVLATFEQICWMY